MSDPQAEHAELLRRSDDWLDVVLSPQPFAACDCSCHRCCVPLDAWCTGRSADGCDEERRARVWLGDQEITEFLSAAHLTVTPWQADLLAKVPPAGRIGPLLPPMQFSVSWLGYDPELFDLIVGFGWLRAQRRRRLSRMHAAYRRRHRG